MKFPVAMLREYVETGLSPDAIGDLLTMAGFELEGIEEVEGDSVLDIKVVSNRGDGLSVFGLSREVLAKDPGSAATDLYRQAVSGFNLGDESRGDVLERTSVTIETEACTRYAARVFDRASNADSPEWLQRRLRQAGLRPLGRLVDLSNYVMLELGQPLHAFDMETLDEGRIIVRGAGEGESLTTLNGETKELSPHHMAICDASKPVALAGIMGGLDTEVGPETKTVLLESAHFSNLSVRRTRKELGLNTDASYRFERSVDPLGVVRGLNRFAMLLRSIDPDVEIVAGVVDVQTHSFESKNILVRVRRATQLLGMEIGSDEAKGYLERLGFAVEGDGEPFLVQSPSWRPDIVREEDLIEEIGRVHGYERIPTLPPEGSTPIGGLHGEHLHLENMKQEMLRCGYVQTVSHSLRDRHPLDSPRLEAIGPQSPGSPEMAWLRTAIWPSLADAALRNGGTDVHLFEIGKVHGRANGTLVEGRRLAILSVGALQPAFWSRTETSKADFFSLKEAVLRTFRASRRQVTFTASAEDPRLHQTRQATLYVGNAKVGACGQIHPERADEAGLPRDVCLAVIDLDALFLTPEADLKLSTISRNPAVRRDISVMIRQSVSFASIEQSVALACGPDLEKLWLGDVYSGQGIPQGMHSLTICLQLRKLGENFTDEEANLVRDRAVAALVELGGSQR